jgi:hypothetical protein
MVATRLQVALEMGHAANWPVGIASRGAVDVDLSNVDTAIRAYLALQSGSDLFEPWVDGIAVVVIPFPQNRFRSRVVVMLYQRVVDVAAENARIEEWWQSTRDRLGLPAASPVSARHMSALDGYVSDLEDGMSVHRARRRFFSMGSRRWCYFVQTLNSSRFGEHAMFVRDVMSVGVAHELIPQTRRSVVHLAVVAGGDCPAN